ncbi:MAG: LuxR C-terminal-related transcriptional regulator, partial [Polyangiaceae bacterium]
MKLTDNRLQTAEWRRVAIALLQDRPDPCALVARDERVVAVNAAFADLLGARPADLVGRKWTEACGHPGDLAMARLDALGVTPTADAWMARTAGGQALRLSVQITPIAETPTVMVSVVHWTLAEQDVASAGTRGYQIGRSPFGTLRWVQADGERPISLDQPCYRALHGRDSPCADCPARAALRPGATRVGVIVSGRGEPEIVSAQAVTRDSVRLTTRRIDDALFAELVEAKLVEHTGDAGLTQRELEVLHLLTLGRAPADVARALGFSVSTAKFHVQNVLRKLGAESRVDLLRVLVHGARDPEPPD